MDAGVLFYHGSQIVHLHMAYIERNIKKVEQNRKPVGYSIMLANWFPAYITEEKMNLD